MSVAKVSFGDNLYFNLVHVIPYYLRGIFIRRPRTYSLLSTLGFNPFSHEYAERLARKYGSKRLAINMAGRETLLLLDVDDVRHVLEKSPDIYAENGLKLKGMSFFQPHSLTVSHGDPWHRRRAFNELALDSGKIQHRHGDHFAADIARAVLAGDGRGYDGIAAIFEEIMLSVVFGAEQQHASLSMLHRRLMHKANRLFCLGSSKNQLRMAAEIRGALLAQRDDCLVGDVDLPFDNHGLQAENQVPHWMFAIRDTLAVNCARALALITADEGSLEKARAELAGHDLSKADDIAKLQYIEGSLQEAMRLWPTTPVLARESLRRDRLGDDEIASGSQVVAFTQYLHRDQSETPDADRFNPERWYGGRTDPQFNHMSNGKQGCAGRDLALFLGTATLANLLSRGYVLDSPRLDLLQSIPATYNYFRLRFTQSSSGMSTK